MSKNIITEEGFKTAAGKINCEVAAIKAVAEVESHGAGFLDSGEPKILFEPHVFWRCLIRKGIDPSKHTKGNSDILYKKWKRGAYGSVNIQHTKLQRAIKIDRDSALMACSWGMFQVLGENWKDLEYASLQSFINDAYESADKHLEMFIRFVQANRLDGFLRIKNFGQFALKYNGPEAEENKYPEKIQAAYKKYAA